jgi:hypothetical protein
MNKALAIIIPLVVVAIIAGLSVGLYMLGSSEASALEKLRDIMIVYLGLLWVIVVLLMAVLVGVLVWVALMLKDKVIPLLETIQETVARLKGTAEFMSEEVASPVISFYGSVAKVRTMSKVFTSRGGKGKKAKSGSTKEETEKVDKFLRKDADLS